MQRKYNEVGDTEDENEEAEAKDEGDDGAQVRFYVLCFLLSFVVLFSLFSLILWAASLSYKPRIIVKVSFIPFQLFIFSFMIVFFVLYAPVDSSFQFVFVFLVVSRTSRADSVVITINIVNFD